VSETGSGRPLTRTGALVFSALFFATGGFVMAIGAGWIAVDPGDLQAPRWVLVCAGVMFLAGGFVPLGQTFNFGALLNEAVGFVVGAGFAAVVNWVAFGPGERRFTSGLSAGGATITSSPGNELVGRIAFGIGAVIVDFLLLALLWRWLQRLQGRDTNSLPRM
jgi:hypothetical protein